MLSFLQYDLVEQILSNLILSDIIRLSKICKDFHLYVYEQFLCKRSTEFFGQESVRQGLVKKYQVLQRLLSSSHLIRGHISNIIDLILQQDNSKMQRGIIDCPTNKKSTLCFLNILYYRHQMFAYFKRLEYESFHGLLYDGISEYVLDQYYGNVLAMAFTWGEESCYKIFQREHAYEWIRNMTEHITEVRNFTPAIILFFSNIIHSALITNHFRIIIDNVNLAFPRCDMRGLYCGQFVEAYLKLQTIDRREAYVCFTNYDFGPLGPFRGRDRPTTIRLKLSDLVAAFMDLTEYQAWIATVHEWATTTRPMNVRQPIVQTLLVNV